MPTSSPLKRLPGSRSQIVVTIGAEEVSAAEAKALAHLAEHVNVQGFRPGKAPPEMVRGKVSDEDLLEETVRGFLPGIIEAANKEHTLKLILPPRVEIQSRTPLTLQITFVERPEVKVKAVDKTKLKKQEPKFDEKDVERMVSYLLEQYRTVEPVDRPAEHGDQVTMDFVGHADEKEVPGTRSTGYPAVIGSKSLIPGFEEGLLGIKRGEKRELKLTFPEKYHAEHLAGKPVVFTVEAKSIDKVNTPALTPEFVKEKSLGASPEDVRKRIVDSMREEEERMDRDRRERLLFEEIRSATQVDIAPELLTEEQQGLVEEIGRQLAGQQQNFDEWLTRTKRTPEMLQKELEEEARKRITLRFGLQKMLEDQAVDVTPEELREQAAIAVAGAPEDQRAQAEAFYREGSDGYEQLRWQKKVEKLVRGMLE